MFLLFLHHGRDLDKRGPIVRAHVAAAEWQRGSITEGVGECCTHGHVVASAYSSIGYAQVRERLTKRGWVIVDCVTCPKSPGWPV